MCTVAALRSLPVLIALAAVGGILSVLIPYLVVHGYIGPHKYSAPLFPLLRNAWEEFHPIFSGLLLLATGGALAFVRPKNWLVLGGSTMLLLPLAAILEMYKDPGSHNLWPIEFVLYIMFVGGPGVLGALLVSRFRGAQTTKTT